MNIKPSGQQVEKWIAKASSEGGKILDPNKLAGLAAQWGAEQAQQPTIAEPDNVRHVLLAAMRDIGAVLNGNYDEDHLEKTCTKIAAILYGRAPSRAFEPELPEPVIAREEYAVGTGEFYTAAQMHEHYAAGVRAGAAGSQDAKRGRYMIDNGSWYRTEQQTRLAVLVPHGSDLSCKATREAAIDAAMQGGQQP